MTLLCVARCRTDQPREAAPSYRLCWPCKEWLPKNLTQLADLAPDLEAALSRANITDGEIVSGSREPAQELNDHAAKARWQIHHEMVTTVRLVIAERGWHNTPANDIASMAKWLRTHVNWLAAHPTAGERANEVSDWINAARNGINPNPPKIVPIGHCVTKDCPGDLTAVVRPQDSLLPSAIVCSWWTALTEDKRTELVGEGTEPHTWRADQWHALGRRLQAA